VNEKLEEVLQQWAELKDKVRIGMVDRITSKYEIQRRQCMYMLVYAALFADKLLENNIKINVEWFFFKLMIKGYFCTKTT